MTPLTASVLRVQAASKVVQALSFTPRARTDRRTLQKAIQQLTIALRGLRVAAGFPLPPAPAELLLVPVRPVRDHGREVQEIRGSKSLLLEVIRRAAADWVLYRTSGRLLQKQLAEDAFTWLFQEGPGHHCWFERRRSDKDATSFLAICEALDLDPESVRHHVKKLTAQQIVGMGRPAEYRRRPSNPSPDVEVSDEINVDEVFAAFEETT